MTIRTLLPLLAVLFTFPAAAADLPAQAEALMLSEAEARADSDGVVMNALAYAKVNPDDPLTLFALRLADFETHMLREPTVGLEALRALVDMEGLDPLARDAARALLAKKLVVAGDIDGAAALHAQRGIIDNWRVIGPCGHHAMASFYQRFPPEEAPVKTLQTPRGPVTWRAPDPENMTPMFDPWQWVYPRQNVAYLQTRFELEKAGVVVLHLQTSSAWSLFLDGHRVHTNDPYAREESLNKFCRLTLGAGRHRLLLKMYPNGRQRGVLVRVLDKDLRPHQGARFATETAAPATTAMTPAATVSRLPALTALQARAEKENAAALHLAAGFFCYQENLLDEGLAHLVAATELAPRHALYKSFRGKLTYESPHLSQAERESRARNLFTEALALRPDLIAARDWLAVMAIEQQRYRKALTQFEAALEHRPENLFVLWRRAKMAVDNDWHAEAEAWGKSLSAAAPEAPMRHMIRADMAAWRGDPEARAESLARIAEALPDDRPRREAWLESLLALGRGDDAVAAMQAACARAPGRADLLGDLGDLQTKLQRWAAAEKAYRDALGSLPHDESLHRRLGDTLYRRGQEDAALASYRLSLALDPGQPALRQLIAKLAGDTDEFWDAHALDPMRQIAAFQRHTARGGTARLIDQTVLAIRRDGSVSNFTHELQYILSEHGIEDARQVHIVGELLEARTILPAEGKTLEPVRLADQPTLTMPALSPGTAVEYAYLEERAAGYDNSVRFPKWYFRSPDTEEAFILSQYILRIPKAMPFSYKAHNIEGDIRFTEKETETHRILIWTARNMPRALHEEGTPHIDERLPFVEISGTRTWEDVNRLLMNEYLGRTIVTRSIRERAQELLAEFDETTVLPPPSLKVDKIFRFVCRQIEHTDSNRPASQVLENGTGDRNLLLLALLNAAGFEPVYVAARSPASILFEPNWEMPQVRHFHLRLVMVPLENGDLLWLDPRHRFGNIRTQSADLTGSTAFLVGRDRAEFKTLPTASPETFAVSEARTLTLPAANEAVRIEGERVVRGDAGMTLKEERADQTEVQRLHALEDHLVQSLPGVVTETLQHPKLETSGTPYRVGYTAESPTLVQPFVDGARALPLCLTPLALLPTDKPPERRETAYHRDRYVVGDDVVAFVLPAGATFSHVPEEIRLRSALGTYQLLVDREKDRLILRRSYQFTPRRIARAEWDDYVELARAIKAAERQVIEYTLPQP